MTEQQTHLQSAISQQKQIAEKINNLSNELSIEKEKFIKLQGVVEYLTNIGVTLPQENVEGNIENTSMEQVSE
jgi:hypothetical protein